ncbi:hypothetical protein B0I35DRAFT_480524 [Stachybotrys elegans]|uniref:Rhodopsin domain-containing protein n=1 Tax=Stachybotrys elegans TaxID=80388 RepID=A0A8K0WQ03_9HYPO|nr:hypothetical protein B0I35DRAFT_480524 [Stachybotrys elegans]
MLYPSSVIACEWVFMVLSYILVGARVYVRLFLKQNKLLASDYFLLVGLVAAQGLLICDSLTYRRGQMENFIDPGIDVLKIRFATNYFFDFGIYFPKFSIIAFYYFLVPTSKTKMRIALHALAAITGISALFTLFADTFWCGPDPTTNWTHMDTCTVFASMDLMRANWSLNFITEILNLVYPFPLLADLRLSKKREKISLFAIFGMGMITVGVSIGRFVTMVNGGNALSVYIWATAELCISIIIVAMTALRPLLKKLTRMISTGLTSSGNKSGYEISSLENQSRRKTAYGTDTSRFWKNGESTHRSRVIATQRDELNGSEVELNEGVIMRTEEVSISSEAISIKGKNTPTSPV